MPKFFAVGSVVAHTVVVGGVIAAQAIAVGPLPSPQIPLTFEGAIPVRIADIPLPPPPRRGRPSPSPETADLAPIVPPHGISREIEVESGNARGVEIGVVEGIVGSFGGDGIVEVPAPPPPPPPAPPQKPQHVGGLIAPPRQIARVAPTYPALARAAQVSGVVILEATIDTRGRVDDVRVLRSIPLLDQAAIDAVRQWVYTPTLLNGVPVPVVMTVTVTFTLGQP